MMGGTCAPSAERGAGSLLGIAVVGSIALVVALALPLYVGLGRRMAVEGGADAAALAAADVAAGISPGIPCEVARTVAAANGVSIDRCDVDGLVVTVRATLAFLGISLTASATAGPPGAGTN